jgi:ABC-2 type transport system ATP-binding protein
MENVAVKVDNLTKKFKNRIIFDSVSFELEIGNIYGFIGPNGSGKSILFKIICGLLSPDQGKVEVFGKIIGKDIDFPEETGLIIETPGFLEDYSGIKNLKYLA